jgi:hypothetical protein
LRVDNFKGEDIEQFRGMRNNYADRDESDSDDSDIEMIEAPLFVPRRRCTSPMAGPSTARRVSALSLDEQTAWRYAREDEEAEKKKLAKLARFAEAVSHRASSFSLMSKTLTIKAA